MRNNEERLGALNQGESPPVQQPQPPSQPEQTLQFVTPTEFVELPSKGEFYSDGHPLYNKDTIEIRYMTAKDEDILTSRALLKKGIAIDRFLQNIIVDKSIRVENLLIGDKNAILVAARITGYGPEYNAKIVCPSCNEHTGFDFNLEECGVISCGDYEKHNVQLTENKTFIAYLEKTNASVEVKLLTSKDEMDLLHLMESRRRKKLPESILTDQLHKMIVSVNGNDSREYINMFIEHMPAIDSRKLRTTYQQIIPNVDMSHEFVCSECNYEGEVDVPFGTNFFWPKQ